MIIVNKSSNIKKKKKTNIRVTTLQDLGLQGHLPSRFSKSCLSCRLTPLIRNSCISYKLGFPNIHIYMHIYMKLSISGSPVLGNYKKVAQVLKCRGQSQADPRRMYEVLGTRRLDLNIGLHISVCCVLQDILQLLDVREIQNLRSY